MPPTDPNQRLQRLCAFTFGVNEAIVKAQSELELFEQVCRVAVEGGGFVMAWVGRNDPDQALLLPVARWGLDEGYVDSIHISTEPGYREGMGPGGTAFRTGEPATCNDIETDHQFFAYWREALARGYRSCAALPLKVDAKPWAVLFVYSTQPHFFDAQELALLTSVAGILSFAMEVRDTDAQHLRAENSLRSSEARLRAVIDNEPECVKAVSLSGHLLEMNHAGLEMIEASNLDVVQGRMVEDFVDPLDRAAWWELHERAGAGGTGRLQVRVRGLRGRFLWMESHAAPLRDDDGRVSSVLYVSRDVTQQRQAFEQLKHKQALLSMASRLGRIGAWEVDLATNTITLSEELAVILDATPGSSPSLDQALALCVPESREALAAAFCSCVQDGTPFDMEVDVVTSQGRRLSMRSIGEAVREADGSISRLQGAFQDITDRTIAQAEILRLNAELEHRVRHRTQQLEMANRELQAFSYSVAHDLRAPLAAIVGFGHALDKEISHSAGERAQHYLARMREGALRTSGMIDALLSLAQLSRAELRWDSVDLSTLVRNATQSFRDTAPRQGVAVEIQPEVIVQGDPRLLQLVMDNLIGNSWKFTERTAQTRIEFGALEGPEGEQIFYVRDNGVGFDMAYAGNLFGAFQRLHRQDEFPGSGIGLANVRRIVTRHSGRIWALARPGEGATFFFTLGDEPA